MSKRKIDDVELLRRIVRLDADLLDPSYPEVLIDEALRDAGGDPEQIGAEGEAFVKKLRAERSRKESGTRFRSRSKVSLSTPATAKAASSLPPTRPKASSDTGPLDDPE